MLLNRENFTKEEKKLKKKNKELENLEKILILLKQSKSLEDLKTNSLSYIYGFEILRNDLSGFYSFNLNKNGGKIRLLCSINEDKVTLEYISLDHYEDFKRYLKSCKRKKVNV
ncbi:MAG: hypothetical protein NC483_04090 [Ruminococcus sp.]|nr:hypothetical protein [Ruminococcus sp.]